MLRAAWDIVDIGLEQISFFKKMAKFCFIFLLFLGIAIVIVTVQTQEIDTLGIISFTGDGGLKMSQFLTFCLSLTASFMAALQAFYNPTRRWQQVRDAVSTMQSSIWMYRCRTGAFKQDGNMAGPSTLALSEAVKTCKDAIMVSADVQETSFHQFYPKRIWVESLKSQLTAKFTKENDYKTDFENFSVLPEARAAPEERRQRQEKLQEKSDHEEERESQSGGGLGS